jgi:hypothetical protein
MVDNFKEFNVTCYVTIAITARGVKAKDARRAAISTGLALQDAIEYGDMIELPNRKLAIDTAACDLTLEVDGSDIDGYLVQQMPNPHLAGSTRLNKNFTKEE